MKTQVKLFFLVVCAIGCVLSCGDPIGPARSISNHDLIELESTQLTITTLNRNKGIIEENASTTYKKAVAILGLSNQPSFAQARAVSGASGALFSSTISVTDEQNQQLNTLVSDFYSEMPAPPRIFTNTIPEGCSEDDRYLYIAGLTIDKLNPESASMLIELAKVYEDDQLKNVSPSEMAQTMNAGHARGVFYCDVPKWQNGNIQIACDTATISSAEFANIKQGFEQWAVASNHSVSFTEITPNVLDWIGRAILIRRFVWVTVGDDMGGAAAYSSCVGNCPWSTITICRSTWNLFMNDLPYIRGLMAHEMGHILGLFHEHQRPDRDSYITIAPKPAEWSQSTWDYNMGKLQDYYFLWWKVVWPVSIGGFDYNSVMIYFSPYIYRIGGAWVYRNQVVSPIDGATIDTLY